MFLVQTSFLNAMHGTNLGTEDIVNTLNTWSLHAYKCI